MTHPYIMYSIFFTPPPQWPAEAVGCHGPTRFLDALEFFSNKFLNKYFLFVLQNF